MDGLIPWLLLMVVLLIFYFLMSTFVINKEHFVPEFLDQGNVKQTMKTSSSSYAQETNHFKLTPPVPEPISGSQTPFRVNMFTAYM
jgi:flagellar basal body-associated protein FliL